MKKMKKFLSVMLIAAMAVGLVACAGSSETEDSSADGEKKVIKFWCHTNTPWIQAYEAMFEKFEAEYPEYDVQLTDFPYEDYSQKLQTSLMADGADVYQM